MFLDGLQMQPLLLILASVTIIYNGSVRSEDVPAFEDSNEALGTDLVAKLRNDANLDLSVDEEYEDLRAELLAYHTTLAKLSAAAAGSRRSLSSTPCWKLDGICINYRLCTGFKYLTQVPGCRGRLNVCCFTWNRSQVRDHRIHDLYPPVYPWGKQYEFGGKGIIGDDPLNDKKEKKERKDKRKPQLLQAKKGPHKSNFQFHETSSSNEVVVHPNFAKKRRINANRKPGLETEDAQKALDYSW